MTQVVKKGGKKQTFSPSKIKNAVTGALRDAGVSKREAIVEEVTGAVIDKYKKRKLVKAAELNKAVLSRLERKSKGAAAAWKRKARKKTVKTKKAVKKKPVKRKRKTAHKHTKRKRRR